VRGAGEAEASGDTDTVLEILILEILILEILILEILILEILIRCLGEAVAPD
jgi:hypothetical protein